MWKVGVAALLCYAIHAGSHVLAGRPAEVLWACHVATLLVGAGALSENATLVGIGVSWLAFGNPLWILDLMTGGEFLLTSPLTHVGGLVLGCIALRQLPPPAKTIWWKAALAFLALLVLTRALTPPSANVNLAFAVAPGWERAFPSYPLYFLLLLGAGTATFFVTELGMRRVLS
ncbi:MAG TPA: hypothetical protein VFQ35_13435 [Polyangiaceae bacterium]|nr:hypothetical protein [Polyangiaceae bacterium]